MLIQAVAIFLLLLLLGAIPVWPHSRKWGYSPVAGLGILLAIVMALMLIGMV